MKKGKYYYKYIINGDDWRINEKEPTENDNAGNKNNVLVLWEIKVISQLIFYLFLTSKTYISYNILD